MPNAIDRTAEHLGWSDVLRTALRLIFFRASQSELVSVGWKHLMFGLASTWLVGMGRYWDNPRVGLAQRMGLGSVVYVFALALFLWLIAWPLRPRHWSYLRVLTFITLVSPPAILYALPVEYFYSVDTANSLNVFFLTVVATWRVALLVFFFRRLGELGWFSIVIATLLPLTVIVVTLTGLNLERVVFDFMGGIREHTAADASYGVLFVLSLFSVLIFIPLLICYLVVATSHLVGFLKERKQASNGS